jgi:hypothetical protein
MLSITWAEVPMVAFAPYLYLLESLLDRRG